MSKHTLTQEQKQAADSRNTSYPIWAAILLVAASEGVEPDAIWQDANIIQTALVRDHVQGWINEGLIEEGKFYWGDEKIEILSDATVKAGFEEWKALPGVDADRI